MGGATTATVDADAVIGSLASPVGSLSVDAVAVQTVSVQTTAVTAGIGSFGANFTIIDVDPTIDAALGTNAVVDASGAVAVIATSTTDAQGSTFGVSAGGLSVGVSLTEVTVAPMIAAQMDNGDNVSAAAVNVGAASYLPASGWDANASATGSAGALIGVVSTNTQSNNNDVVTAFIGSSAKIAVVGAVVVTALNYTAQKTSSDSNAFGLIAAGLATSQSNSNTTTNAYIGSSTHITSADFKLTATGDDNNFAHTNAGSGRAGCRRIGGVGYHERQHNHGDGGRVGCDRAVRHDGQPDHGFHRVCGPRSRLQCADLHLCRRVIRRRRRDHNQQRYGEHHGHRGQRRHGGSVQYQRDSV